MNDISVIHCTNGGFVVVDAEQFERLNSVGWQLNSKSGYAQRTDSNRRRPEYMHRVVNSTPEGLRTDHINRCRIDNTARNLRSVSEHQNHWNVSASATKPKTSQFIGVSKYKDGWRSTISTNGQYHHIGRYASELEAFLAYCEAAWFEHGEFVASRYCVALAR